MLLLFALAVLAPPNTAMPHERSITVEQRHFDCFTLNARRLKAPRGDLFYLDLRRCPPKLSLPDRLGSFPAWSEPGRTSSGKEVDSVVLITRRELSCLRDKGKLAKMRSVIDAERYAIAIGRCR